MQQSQFEHHTAYSNAVQALDLPDNQRLAIEALISGKKRGEAAQDAGVCRKTIQRWLLDSVFLAALHQARCCAWMEVNGELHAHNLNAVRTLVAVLECDQPRARVLAAKTILDLSAKSLEFDTLLQRCALIEEELERKLTPVAEGGPNGPSGMARHGSAPPAPSARRAYDAAGPLAAADGVQRSPGFPTRWRGHATERRLRSGRLRTAHSQDAASSYLDAPGSADPRSYRSSFGFRRQPDPVVGSQPVQRGSLSARGDSGEWVHSGTSGDMHRRSPLARPLLLAALLASRARTAVPPATGRSAA